MRHFSNYWKSGSYSKKHFQSGHVNPTIMEHKDISPCTPIMPSIERNNVLNRRQCALLVAFVACTISQFCTSLLPEHFSFLGCLGLSAEATHEINPNSVFIERGKHVSFQTSPKELHKAYVLLM